jgi:hypothetical protein
MWDSFLELVTDDGENNENGFAGAFGGDGGTCEFPQTYISSVVTSTEGK